MPWQVAPACQLTPQVFAWLSGVNRFAMEFDDRGEGVLDCARNGVQTETQQLSEGGEIRRDLKRGVLTVSSGRSQVLSAFFAPGVSYETQDLRVRLPESRFGTIGAVSLTDFPIARSSRVYPVSDRGVLLPALPTTWRDGRLVFRCEAKTIYYLIK